MGLVVLINGSFKQLQLQTNISNLGNQVQAQMDKDFGKTIAHLICNIPAAVPFGIPTITLTWVLTDQFILQ